jgi:hypothetical protein
LWSLSSNHSCVVGRRSGKSLLPKSHDILLLITHSSNILLWPLSSNHNCGRSGKSLLPISYILLRSPFLGLSLLELRNFLGKESAEPLCHDRRTAKHRFLSPHSSKRHNSLWR